MFPLVVAGLLLLVRADWPRNVIVGISAVVIAVASIVLAEPMRRLKNEFMIGIRGYLRSTPEDDEVIRKAERAAREAIEKVILENA